MLKGFLLYLLLSLSILFSVYGQQDTTNSLLNPLQTEVFPASKLKRELKGLVSKSQLSASDSILKISILDSLISFYKNTHTKKYNYFLSQKKNIDFEYVIPLQLSVNENNFTTIDKNIGVWKDTTNGKITIENIIDNPKITFSANAIDFSTIEVGAYYWLCLKLVGNGVRDELIALQVGSVFETWSEIIFYQPVEDEAFRVERSGTDVDPENKPVKQWRNYFNVDVATQSETIVYVRVHSNAQRFHPRLIYAYVGDAASVSQGSEESTYAQGIFQGILWVMAFYNLLLFFIIRDKLYLYYVLMIIGIQLNVFYYYRYIYFLFPTSQLLILSCIVISHLFMIGGGLLFMKSFLNVKELLPTWNKIINIINYILVIAVVVYIANNLISTTPTWQDKLGLNTFALFTILAIALITSVLSLVIGIVVLRKGYLAARYYLIATSGLLLGGFFYALSYLLNANGIIVESDIFTYLFQGGVVVQLVFYALGIGYQVNRLEREKSDALAENLELQKETTFLLEKKVKKRTLEIEQQKEEIEAINSSLMDQKGLMEKRNQDITSSINYARRIQDAVLPDLRAFKRSIPNCFVLYTPRDIVSGDFYWFAQKGNEIILAAADCTGHGVPGAFMSILGDSYLNQIVNLQGITKANSILSRLHGQIREALRQSSTENKDGMDISICVINLEHNHVTFAGAKRPLLYIQNDTIFEVKGDKHSVGGFHTKAENSYTSHKIDFAIPTAFYIFSDGYVDQFGGEHNRKFMTKNFKSLLLEIHKEPMVKQRQILDQKFEDWKGKNKQIDDVIVVGFQV